MRGCRCFVVVALLVGCGSHGPDGSVAVEDLRAGPGDQAGTVDAALPPDLVSPCGPCRAPTPLCRPADRRCVACLEDADCGPATICRAGACEPGCSRHHDDCADAGACEPDAGVCRRCRSDRDCPDPARSQCDVGSGLCRPCSPMDDRCPADTFCREAAGVFTCVPGCKADPECQQMNAAARCCDHACIDTSASAAHCGRCGNGCGGNGACCAGTCRQPDSDPANCGACGKVCTGNNTVPTCQGGACVPGACLPGFADCNGQPNDGCEITIDSDTRNCGGCNRPCGLAHSTPACIAGACGIAACDAGYRNCNGAAQDGCELSVDADPKNCGGCGAECGKVPHGTSSTCRGSQCIVDSCEPGFLDCNKMGADGCETQPLTDVKNCGTCGMACKPPPNASAACAAGMCKLDKCNLGYADCDVQPANGCEAWLAADNANCGGCGKACQRGFGCVAGVCQALQGRWTQMFPARPPSARFNTGLAYDSNRKVVVMFGGTNWNVFEYNETWEWDGVNWTQKFPAASPLGRDGGALVYDEARKVVVLFGGSFGAGCQQNYADTWEYDGVNWLQIMTRSAPAIRCYPYAAYDATRKVTVVFGGGACQNYNDTWEYDGKDWTQVQLAHSPTPRVSGQMSFDRGRNVSTLFGGWDNFSVRITETWEYDGKDWTLLFPQKIPAGRTAHNMAYHDLLGVSVVFGGYTGGAELGDTWEWDGKNWAQRVPNPAPGVRDGIGMAYDSARQQIVMFGGNNNGVMNNETWIYAP